MLARRGFIGACLTGLTRAALCTAPWYGLRIDWPMSRPLFLCLLFGGARGKMNMEPVGECLIILKLAHSAFRQKGMAAGRLERPTKGLVIPDSVH